MIDPLPKLAFKSVPVRMSRAFCFSACSVVHSSKDLPFCHDRFYPSYCPVVLQAAIINAPDHLGCSLYVYGTKSENITTWFGFPFHLFRNLINILIGIC